MIITCRIVQSYTFGHNSDKTKRPKTYYAKQFKLFVKTISFQRRHSNTTLQIRILSSKWLQKAEHIKKLLAFPTLMRYTIYALEVIQNNVITYLFMFNNW